MTDPDLDPTTITGYHAHLYYDAASRDDAAAIRTRIAAQFPRARLGNWHDGPVGPHPGRMYQVALAVEEFSPFLPLLMLNRRHHYLLLHPLTRDDYIEHAHQ